MAKRASFSTSMRLLVQAAKKLGVTVKPIAVDRNLAKFTYRGRSVLAKGTVPPANGMVASAVSTSKALTKVVLKEAGITRFPKATVCHSMADANAAATALGYPVVVKPIGGAHGFGVTVGVRNRTELVRAVDKVQDIIERRQYVRGFVVEQLKHGRDYRFYVIDGRVWAVLERVPASVIGDGRASVQQLIKRWNAKPEVGASDDFDKPLMAITVDDDVKRYLREQHLTLNSRLASDQRAWLCKTANISMGGTSYDMTDEASPQLKRWAARAVEVLGLRVGGIDILVKNLAAATPAAAGAWILEVNDSPGIDIHHYPYQGKPQPVAHGLVKSMFPAIKLPARVLPKY